MIAKDNLNIELEDRDEVTDHLNNLVREYAMKEVRDYISWPQFATIDGQRSTDVDSTIVVSVTAGIVLVRTARVTRELVEETFGPNVDDNSELLIAHGWPQNYYVLAIAGTEKVKKFCHKISVDLIDHLIDQAGYEPKNINYNLLVDYDSTLSVDEYFNVNLQSRGWFADQTTFNWKWMDSELTTDQLNEMTEVANKWLAHNHCGWRVAAPEQYDGELFWTVVDL